MKAIYKSILAAALVAPALTGCIDETFPTDGVTLGQLSANDNAVEALVWAMPAWLNNLGTVDSNEHYDWGYGSIMHIRDVMTGDFVCPTVGYNWYQRWGTVINVGESYLSTQFIWNWYTQQVLTTNKVIGGIEADTDSPTRRSFLGYGHAFRAFVYMDMARFYEFLPNNAVSSVNADGNDVKYLTVPIVTELTTEEEAGNNPRADHPTMFNFILSDLQKAEGYFSENSDGRLSKALPDLSVVYGLYARLYMWEAGYQEETTGDKSLYATAAEYARKAITQSGCTPLNEAEWTNTATGFNDMSSNSWMWGMQYMKEDRVVTSGILNWTSWMSNETDYGYAIAGAFAMIDASLYNSINDRDFRKLSYVAPEGSVLSGRETFVSEHFKPQLGEYCSLKFRPGSGNYIDPKVGSACAVPLMRVEEMYFIEAEAKAHANPADGKALLESFMQQNRYASYRCNASSEEDVIEEIILQKRIELWGEGQSFFDIKRLNMSVIRAYDGSNYSPAQRYNTNGRPAWMNFCIVRSEGNNNKGVVGYNNPSPEGAYVAIK